MKWAKFALVGLMLLGTISATQRVTAQDGTSTPVEPQQNDARVAVGQINPKKPIQIRVVSQTKVPVVASLGTAAGDRIVAPGKSVIFGRLHTSYLLLPLDLQVTLKDTPDPNNPLSVYVSAKPAGNEIIVTIKTALSGSGNSSQTMHVNEQGGIFVY